MITKVLMLAANCYRKEGFNQSTLFKKKKKFRKKLRLILTLEIFLMIHLELISL